MGKTGSWCFAWGEAFLHTCGNILECEVSDRGEFCVSDRERIPGYAASNLDSLACERGDLVRMMTENERQMIPSNPSAVLLIDDNAIQAATRQTILRRAGYYVIAALNPVRALDQFRNNEFPAPIGAIITDHLMPGMSGSEFVRELRKTNPELPVMVISGLEEAETEYEGLNARFLLKPLSPELLLSNLREMLGSLLQERGAA